MTLDEYRHRRVLLLIELRLIRRTHPSRRVVKEVQRGMRKLRTFKRMMEEAQ